jgi:hypothetical protein
MFINGVYVDTFHWGTDRYAYLSALLNVHAVESAIAMPATLTVNGIECRLINHYADPEDQARADQWQYEPTATGDFAFFIVVNNQV